MELLPSRLWAILLMLMQACVTRNEIEDLEKNQQQILAKLDKLEKLVVAQQHAAPAAPVIPSGPDPAKVYAFPVGDSPQMGPADAWVTIVEISDFQCPFCSRVVPTLKQVSESYGNQVRIVFKHNPLPFHPRAMPAAIAAECARMQNRFWPMFDKLFSHQRELDDAHLQQFADEIGLHKQPFVRCTQHPEAIKTRIENDRVIAERLGARGTPAFFINGRFLSGAQPFVKFKQLVDEELNKAKASGIAAKLYYSEMIEKKGLAAM